MIDFSSYLKAEKISYILQEYLSKGRLLIDIMSALPKSFIQEMISYILQEYLSKGRLLFDIISDLPKSFK